MPFKHTNTNRLHEGVGGSSSSRSSSSSSGGIKSNSSVAMRDLEPKTSLGIASLG